MGKRRDAPADEAMSELEFAARAGHHRSRWWHCGCLAYASGQESRT